MAEHLGMRREVRTWTVYMRNLCSERAYQVDQPEVRVDVRLEVQLDAHLEVRKEAVAHLSM